MSRSPGNQLGTHSYKATAFYWAIIYKGHITALSPREGEARKQVNRCNLEWQKNSWGKDWSIKRFRFHFKGLEIDAYEHQWERKEKINNN